MDHKEKAIGKRQSYVNALFTCTDVVTEDICSYFYSERDGLFRKHSFRENEMTVELVDSIPSTKIVEVTPIKEIEPVKVTKKTTKKKGK